jgi:hypothetical protein
VHFLRCQNSHRPFLSRWGATAVGWNEEIRLRDSDDDFLIAYDAVIDIALAAFGADGALERTMDLPVGLLSGADVLAIVTRDQFVRGWDLARAIGHKTDLDPELEEILIQAADISTEMRGSGDWSCLRAHRRCAGQSEFGRPSRRLPWATNVSRVRGPGGQGVSTIRPRTPPLAMVRCASPA